MTQKDKELLLKDLYNRLPYGVMVQPAGSAVAHKVIGYDKGLVRVDIDVRYDLENVKLYLRPLSSMTEEEKKELKNLFDAEEVTSDSICYIEGGTLEEYLSHISYSFCSEIIDWLNAHHFDYRGLIEKGLAIAVTDGNNPYKV